MPSRPATAPRKQAVQARALATVDAVLTATARILVRDGYDRASTNRIAEEAGVSIGSLYQYYPSKEALVAALLERHIEQMATLIRSEMALIWHEPVPIVVERLVRSMIAAHAVDPKLHKVLVEQVPRIGRLGRVHALEKEVTALARAFLEAHRAELRPEIDCELSAIAVVTMVEALTHAAVLARPDLLGDGKLAAEITAMAIRYLLPDRALPSRPSRRASRLAS